MEEIIIKITPENARKISEIKKQIRELEMELVIRDSAKLGSYHVATLEDDSVQTYDFISCTSIQNLEKMIQYNKLLFNLECMSGESKEHIYQNAIV